jgi:hypothetical protein
MTTPEDIEKYTNRYLVYSAKNILREAAFMSVFLCISLFYNADVTWKGVLFIVIASIGFGFWNIAIQRYLHKKGKLSIPSPPKYGDKTWKQLQADKGVKNSDS